MQSPAKRGGNGKPSNYREGLSELDYYELLMIKSAILLTHHPLSPTEFLEPEPIIIIQNVRNQQIDNYSSISVHTV